MSRILCSLTLFTSIIVAPQPIHACQCSNDSRQQPTAEVFAQASAVFLGRVVDIDRAEPWLKYASRWLRAWYYRFVADAPESFHEELFRWAVGDSYGLIVAFEIQRSWKGITSSTYSLRTGFGGGDCGYTFSVGEIYLVYALPPHAPRSIPTTDICTRTTLAKELTSDIERLDKLGGAK